MVLDNVTIAILAGGNSSRFGSEKALAQFRGTPLVTHMLNITKGLVSRAIVVASDDEQKSLLSEVVKDAEIVVDADDYEKSALNGSVTAFEYSGNDYTLLLPVDSPLTNRGLLNSLLELREGHGAVVPAWSNGFVEPMHSVYLTEHAYDKGLQVLENGQRKMQNLLDSLTNVLYVQTEILKMFDMHLQTFANANTPNELKRLEEEVLRAR
ncbi:MAG: molybdenum cofactor guanylyltransferase [Candidatus Thorarchaeota archaeon]|jgi:molybdopterin-guanine dinucleotide biosynthesis protein A